MPNFQRGFESQYEEISIDDVEVEGKIPDWLDGTIIRNGSGQFELNRPKPGQAVDPNTSDSCYDPNKRVCYVHWFDGLAMPHRFTIREGHVSFANRYLITDTYTKDNQTGVVNYRMCATDPDLTWWQKIISPFYIQFMDNTNVHTVLVQDQYVALTERTKGFVIDPQTLATGEPYIYKNVNTTSIQTAHPHYDPKTKMFFNNTLEMGMTPAYKLFSNTGREVTQIASIPSANPSYMHSFAMTEKYLILAEFPFRISLWGQMQFLFTDTPIFGNFTWNPQYPTVFTVVDKATGSVIARKEGEPFFAFHHINAFERGGEIVIDVAAYADSTIIQGLYLQTMRSRTDFSTMTAEFRRYHVPITSNGSVTREKIVDKQIMLPRINYNGYNTRDYQWTYGISHYDRTDDFVNQIVKIDVKGGAVVNEWHKDGHYPSEPVFAPRPGSTEEDDGVLLSTVYDSFTEKSYLLILNAKTFDWLATAHIPIRLPFAFHGRWYSNGVMY